jgi:hypothetical protein
MNNKYYYPTMAELDPALHGLTEARAQYLVALRLNLPAGELKQEYYDIADQTTLDGASNHDSLVAIQKAGSRAQVIIEEEANRYK